MRKYFIANTITFILIMLAIFFVSAFFYGRISNRVLIEQVAINLESVSTTTTDNIENQLAIDYEHFTEFLANYASVAELNLHKAELSLSGNPVLGFGEFLASANQYTINGINYVGNNEIIPSGHYDQTICIFNFGTDFTADGTNAFSDQLLLIFKKDNLFLYLDANEYFEIFFINNKSVAVSNCYIINKDGFVHYNNKQGQIRQFFDYLREYNGQTTDYVTKLKEAMQSNVTTSLDGVKLGALTYYVGVSPIISEYSTDSLYVVLVFGQTDVQSSLTQLTTPLLVLFILYSAIIVIGMVILVILLYRKNNDIEYSKVLHYYDKVYIIKVNRHGKIKSMNKSLQELIPNYRDYHNLSDFTFKEKYVDINEAAQTQRPITLIWENDGEEYQKKYFRFVALRDYYGRALVGSEITEEENELQKYRRFALYNHLTALPNLEMLRTVLEEDLREMRSQIQHQEPLEKKVLVAFDIYKFKNFNNLFSTRVGDQVLIETSNIIQESLENYNAELFNLEADQFCVVFSKLDDYKTIIAWVEKVIQIFKKPIEIDNNYLIVELNFGIFNIEVDKYENLSANRSIEYASKTLQKIKTLPDKNYEIFDMSISRFLSKEQVLEQDIRKAITNREFVMYLQPQYSNTELRIVGFEALIRWDNPKYKYQSPYHFIQVAERNNMIIQIGQFVIDESFRLSKLLENFNVTISLNISPLQLMQAGFVNEFLDLARKHDINPSSIAIEITETFLMENFQAVIEKLNLLKNIGFHIHLDDFGNGYSSMLYLKELPIDTLKIDKDFIDNVATDKYSKAIVTKVISLGSTLGLHVIAEGVEDDKQNQFLIKNGCDIIQGYIVSPAVPYEQALDLLQKYNIEKQTIGAVKPEPKPKTKK